MPARRQTVRTQVNDRGILFLGGWHASPQAREGLRQKARQTSLQTSFVGSQSRIHSPVEKRSEEIKGGVLHAFFTREYRRAPCDILRDNGAHPKADRHARHPCTHRSASMSQLGPRSLARHERAQRARTLTRTPLSHSPPPRPTRSPSLHISPTAARAQKVHDREHQPCSPGAFSRSRSPARTLSTTKSPPPAASSHRSPTRGSAAAVSQRAVDGSGRGAERSRVESTRVRVAWRGVA